MGRREEVTLVATVRPETKQQITLIKNFFEIELLPLFDVKK